MGKKVIVIAPHPDDETLGCGGTLLKHKAQGDEIHWVIAAAISADETVLIEKISSKYGFHSTHQLNLPVARFDTLPMADLVAAYGKIFKEIHPEVVYLPHRGDIHTDHTITFDAVAACTKWFRYSSVKRVLAYETLSETDFILNPDSRGFHPNVFIEISSYLESKIAISKLYANEMGNFPFPRSEEAIRALSQVRGAASGFKAAEAFMLLKEIIS